MAYVPNKLYKFVNSRYIDNLKKLGRIAIGTTSSYRKDDGIEGGRNDLHDARRLWAPEADVDVVVTSEHWFGKTIPVPPDKELRLMPGASIDLSVHAAIFCTSTHVSKSRIRRMKDDFDCDTFFQINDVRGFAEALTTHPALNGVTCGGALVEYSDLSDEEIMIGGPIDIWRKRSMFAWQREYRLVWETPAEWQAQVIDAPRILPFIDFPNDRLNAWHAEEEQ